MLDPHVSTPTAWHMSQLSMKFGSKAPKELKDALQKIANERLIAAKTHGVGFDEVREIAERTPNPATGKMLLTGNEESRYLSFGASLMRAASANGPIRTRRPSRHKKANGRLVAVYVHAMYADALALEGRNAV